MSRGVRLAGRRVPSPSWPVGSGHHIFLMATDREPWRPTLASHQREGPRECQRRPRPPAGTRGGYQLPLAEANHRSFPCKLAASRPCHHGPIVSSISTPSCPIIIRLTLTCSSFFFSWKRKYSFCIRDGVVSMSESLRLFLSVHMLDRSACCCQ